jgi:hypothetical protein
MLENLLSSIILTRSFQLLIITHTQISHELRESKMDFGVLSQAKRISSMVNIMNLSVYLGEGIQMPRIKSSEESFGIGRRRNSKDNLCNVISFDLSRYSFVMNVGYSLSLALHVNWLHDSNNITRQKWSVMSKFFWSDVIIVSVHESSTSIEFSFCSNHEAVESRAKASSSVQNNTPRSPKLVLTKHIRSISERNRQVAKKYLSPRA